MAVSRTTLAEGGNHVLCLSITGEAVAQGRRVLRVLSTRERQALASHNVHRAPPIPYASMTWEGRACC